MSDLSLQDILRAEQEAENKAKAAAAKAEQIRSEAAERVARVQKETDERIEASRRDRMARVRTETEEIRTKTSAEADAAVADWRRRFEEKHDQIVNDIVRLLTGRQEG